MNWTRKLQFLFVVVVVSGGTQAARSMRSLANTTEKLDLITTMTGGARAVVDPSSAQESNKCARNGGSWAGAAGGICQRYRQKERASKMLGPAADNDIWKSGDMLQHPIDEEPRRLDRGLGEMCLYSSDCRSGCCMLERETKIRSCQPKAIQGEKCTTAQIKADLYVDVCPCESGDSNCVYPGEYCSK